MGVTLSTLNGTILASEEAGQTPQTLSKGPFWVVYTTCAKMTIIDPFLDPFPERPFGRYIWCFPA